MCFVFLGERGRGIPIDENAKWKSWMWMKDVLAYILRPQEPNLMWTWFHVFLCFGAGVIPIDENAKWESWMWMKNEVAYLHPPTTSILWGALKKYHNPLSNLATAGWLVMSLFFLCWLIFLLHNVAMVKASSPLKVETFLVFGLVIY